MPSERIQRQIDRLLDEAETAVSASHWTDVAENARAVLSIDEGNEDALAFLTMAEANGVTVAASSASPASPSHR